MKVYDKLFAKKVTPGVIRCGPHGDGLRIEVVEAVTYNSDRVATIRLGSEKNASLCIDKNYACILRDFFTDLEKAL